MDVMEKYAAEVGERYRVLVVGTDRARLHELGIESNGDPGIRLELIWEEDLQSGVARLQREFFEVLLVDLDAVPGDVVEEIGRLRRQAPGPSLIVLAEENDEKRALEAIEGGAHEYILRNQWSRIYFLSTLRLLRQCRMLRDQLEQKTEEVEGVRLRYESILRGTPNGLCVVSSDWVIQWANPSLGRILNPAGVGTQNLAGESFRDFFEGPEAFEVYCLGAPKVKGVGGVDVRETVFRRADGGRVPVQISTVRLDPAKSDPGYAITVIDLTKQKESDKQLRRLSRAESQRKLEYRQIPTPAYTWRKSGDDFVLVDYNDAALSITGGKIVEWTGKTLREMYSESPDVLQAFRECEESGTPVVQEMPYRFRTTGELRYLHVTYAYVPPGQVMVYTEDITSRKSAEKALRESEERYRAIVETQTELICRYRPDGTVTFINEACSQWFRWQKEDFLGKDFLQFIHEEDRAAVREMMDILVRTRKPAKVLHRVVTPDGSVRWTLWSKTPILDEKGNISEIQGVGHDMTERKEAEDTLRRSEHRFSRIFHSSPLPITITRLSDGCLVDVNETFVKFTGLAREDLLGQRAIDPGLWAIPQERLKFFAELKKNGTVSSFPVSVRSESGEFHKALLSGEVIEIEGEQCALLMAQDITDLKRAEAAVEYSEARIRAMLSAVPDTIFLLSADGVYMDYHTYDPDHLVVPPEKFLGKNFEDVLPAELTDRYRKAFHQARETGELQVLEFEAKVRDETLHFESRVVPSGENEFLEIVRNVTEEKKLRMQLLASERLAAVGQTAAMAAHCMRNIFTAFRGANSLLNRALTGENLSAARQAQQLLERSAARLQMAFMEMLDYSRTRYPNRVDLDLEALSKEIVKDLELLNYKQCTIELTVEPEARTAHLDRDWMYRALLNLGSNALDAMPQGGRLELHASVRNHNGKPQCLIIEVRDSGTGIDQRHIPHLFEPLFTTKESRGTGLGLACVRQFIESQGGSIEVETAAGRGTTFRLVFDQEAQSPAEA